MEKLEIVQGDIPVESKIVFSYGIHMHTHYELTLYEAFPGNVSVNGKDYEISQTTAILICPSDFHEITVKEKTDAKYIKIGFNTEILKGRIPDFSSIMTNIESGDFAAEIFKEILKKSKDKAYAELLINTLVHIMCERGENLYSLDASRGYQITAAAAKIINESFSQSITLSSVAKELSVAPQHLSNVFAKNLGVNFSVYLTNIRLEYAKNKIANSRKSLTEICYESGYNNFSHFSRCFKRKYGVSPRQYKSNSL